MFLHWQELTPKILRSFAPKALLDALAELEIPSDDASLIVECLNAAPVPVATSQPTPPPLPPLPPESDAPPAHEPALLPSPAGVNSELRFPLGWPKYAAEATPFLTKVLGAKRVRVVGRLAAQHEAILGGLTLAPGGARHNATRVRDRTGWAIVGGFVLCERADADPEEHGAARYVGVPHYWNVTPRGLWVDATPRSPAHSHSQRVLVESSSKQVEVPAPAYMARMHEPMVIAVAEGLCNRLRAVLSYRLVAHEAGRPLHVVWAKDGFCPGYFDELFLPIPGVRFVKALPADRTASSVHVATDTHASVKGSAAETYSCVTLPPVHTLHVHTRPSHPWHTRPFPLAPDRGCARHPVL